MLVNRLVPAVVVVGLEVVVEVDRAARAPRTRRRRGGGRFFAAALAQRVTPVAVRLARARHQSPVDDRVRLALPFEARAPDRRVVSTGSDKLVAELSMSNAAELMDRSSSSSTSTLAAIDWPTMRASS